jgi:hypothetical protein
MEPVQDLVRILLERDGYFVRSDVRFSVPGRTSTGKTAGYADLDIIAVRFEAHGAVITDKIWAEVKAHLTSSLTPGYIRGFKSDFATLLDLDKVDLSPSEKAKYATRQELALQEAARLLGRGFRRVLYFGGKMPADKGEGAKQLLRPDVEVIYVRELVKDSLRSLTHLEGNEPLVRIINTLDAYGLLAGDEDI